MDRLIVSVSQNAVIRAEAAIRGCDRCSPGATTPFSQVLGQSRIRRDAEVMYLLPVLACCPKCRAEIDELTLVEPKPAAARSSVPPLCESTHES